MVYPDHSTGSAEWKNHWHWLLNNNGTISTNGDPNIVLGVKNGKVTLVHKSDKVQQLSFKLWVVHNMILKPAPKI